MDWDGTGIALMWWSWAVLFALLSISFLSFIEFPLTLCELFLLVQGALSVLFFEVFALALALSISVEGRGAMRLIVHCNFSRVNGNVD
jgi:hypothetical protein